MGMVGNLLAAIGAAASAGAAACDGPVVACERASPGAVAIVTPGRAIPLVVSTGEDKAVLRAADDLRGDLGLVGGTPATTLGAMPARAPVAVIAGTLGHSPLVDGLVRAGKVDVRGLAGQWEGFVEQVVERPAPGINRALVIVGADRRGTVYGLYDISAKIGVSPWSYWADVPAQRHDRLFLTAGRIADHPVVKYRGIFLNDEDPALGGWAKARFGGLNHEFYGKLFTLMLRLKANTLWPAMWGKSLWDDDAQSAPLAREMGIVLGTSHHEPMERSHVEWQRHGTGPWNYATNAARLLQFWREGIERRGQSEDLVTVGMRGDGDEPMTQGTATDLLEHVVADQRAIVADVTRQPAERTPQVWALYKEVQDYYDKGMRVPDDVTLLFSDDNWGDLRRLPKPGAARAGGYGIYYHFDYVGGPRNYKWIDTNAIPRVWQQMKLARAHGADRLWIVNVGDLKPMEFATSFFLDLAWNPDAMTLPALETYPARWAAQQFGEAQAGAIGELLARYGQLAARRKPELLDAASYDLDRGEWQRVMDGWNALDADARRIGAGIGPARRDAYYELVLHRIEAMANLHRLYFAVARNHRAARQGSADTAALAAEARRYFAQDAAIRRRYEVETAAGKWTSMMAQTHIGYTGWQEPPADVMPSVYDRPVGGAPAPRAPASMMSWLADQAARLGPGWQVVPRLGRDGPGVITAAAVTVPVEHPGGTSAHLSLNIELARSGPVTVRVLASPGLDIRGDGKHRYAVSIDDAAPVIVNLLAGETERSWERAVADNGRLGTTTLVASAGRHRLNLWRVDPELVFQRIEVMPAAGPSLASK